jgi:tetratricopeptide (TPR) repeat protein
LSLDLLGEAKRRLDAGDPSSALRLAERGLEASRASGSAKAIASGAYLVGDCLYAIGDLPGARSLGEEALRLSESLGDSAMIGANLNLLSVVEIGEGRPETAIAMLRRSYDLRAQALGPDDGDTIESLNNLAAALWRVGEQDEAIRLHEDALGCCERALGEDHRRTAETLNALAVKLEQLPGSQARAQELYERGLRSAEAALGPDSDLVARLLANVATARMSTGDADSAGPFLERALELHERHFGPTSRWTAYVLLAQGSLAQQLGRLEDARGAYERAFVICLREAGPDAPETLDATMGLVGVLSETGSDEARELATALYIPLLALDPQLAASFPGGASPDPAHAAQQLLHFADRLGRRVEPDPSQTEALERAKQLTEEADTAYLAGDLGPAADRLREAIALLETARGPMDTSLVEPLSRLRLVLRFAGTESQVLPVLRRIASIYADAYGDIHPLAIRALGEIYWQERREYGPAGGRETAARIESLVRNALGEESAVGRLVQDVIAAAREAGEGVEPEDPPLSARRERILAEPDPLVDELLPDLNDTPWPSLDHAYGPAIDTPLHLRLLLAGDDRVRDDALELMGESLFHHGSTYPATAPARALMRRLAADDRVPGRAKLAAFLLEVDARYN